MLTIVLGQIGDSLRRRKNPLTSFVRNLQYFVLPPLVLFLIVDQILGWKDLIIVNRIIETVFWIAVIYTSISLLQVVLTVEEKHYDWQIPVANLFFQVVRAAIILLISSLGLAEVWLIDISKAAQALGIGSLVIALALQDTLSNLVSGFLLLADSPFKKGDWLQLDDIEGQVIDLNWRSVRLKTIEGNVVIIPNGSLGKERIINYSLPDEARGVWIDVAFSCDDSPHRVKEVIRQVLLETQWTDLDKGFKIISTDSFDDFTIGYKVMFMAKDFVSTYKAASDFRNRLYYASQRHGLTMPYPISHVYYGRLNNSQLEHSQPEIVEYLQSLPYFISLKLETIEELALNSTIEYYGKGESIIQEGALVRGLYIIQNGNAKILVRDLQGIPREVTRVSSGDFFGESVFMTGKPSLVSVSAIDEVKVIKIQAESAANLLVDNPKLAKKLDESLEQRQESIRKIKQSQGKHAGSLVDSDGFDDRNSILKNFKSL